VETIAELLLQWPAVTYRQVAKVVGQLGSMHPVFEGLAYLRTRLLQTFVNIRNYRNAGWEDVIQSDFLPLFSQAKGELAFWQRALLTKNVRMFAEPPAQALLWVDAADTGIGGFGVSLLNAAPVRPVITADNILLDPINVLRKFRSMVPIQADELPWQGRDAVRVRDDADLDPAHVEKTFVVHRNLAFFERAMDSNERELIAAQ
jgi:hypothetical protein